MKKKRATQSSEVQVDELSQLQMRLGPDAAHLNTSELRHLQKEIQLLSRVLLHLARDPTEEGIHDNQLTEQATGASVQSAITNEDKLSQNI
ncbi:MAG: hypothetical protein NTV02_01990 [Candidatus Zambryskibacteria bacterium]|nr:hypothetical protein [Candidatus Zambryskibacteria bacterium]